MNTEKQDTLKIVAIIQARMGSSRLPGKVMEDIAGMPMIAWVVKRAQLSEKISRVMIATTDDPNDYPIEHWCNQNKVQSYRGSVFDVLDRFYQAAKSIKADIIVRLTADCPLIDPVVIDQVIDMFENENADFAANRLPPPYHRTYPIGLDVEVVSFKALEQAWHEAHHKFEREHVLPYLYSEKGRFNVSILDAEKDFGALRWTVDTPEDLEFLRALAAQMDFSLNTRWLEILDFLEAHPELALINADVQHKSMTDIDARANGDQEQKHV